jgi:hypothetical protein
MEGRMGQCTHKVVIGCRMVLFINIRLGIRHRTGWGWGHNKLLIVLVVEEVSLINN